MRRLLLVLVCGVLVSGCYHATINTGLTPSPTKIERKWAPGWIYGLVPPSPTETAAKCPKGVARIDTQLSFPNMLVGIITWSIFTPMDIEVTCAAS